MDSRRCSRQNRPSLSKTKLERDLGRVRVCPPIPFDVIVFRRKLAGVSGQALEQFAERARRGVGLRGGVNVLIAANAELRRLNRHFRGKDKSTDVLSFPASHGHYAGDIAISAALGADQARRLGHSLADELKVLLLHGMLHLAGYDHESDSGRMARKELQLQRRFGLPTALIERAQDRARSRRRKKRA